MANIKNFGIVGLGSDVQFGKGGAKLVQSEGTFAAKAADGVAFVRFAIANAVAGSDAVTLQQLNAAVAAVSGDFDALQIELDATQAGAGLAADGAYVAPATGVLSTATSLKDADDKLAAALAAEVLDRAADELVLTDAVAAVDAKADAIQTELDVSQASIGLGPDGDLTLADGAYLAGVTTIVAAVEALDVAAAAAKAAADAAQADVDAVDGRLVTVEGLVDGHTTDIAALESTDVAQAALIAALESADVALDGRIDLLEAAVQDDTRLDNLEANAVSQQAEIDAVELAATALTTRVTTAEGDIDALETRAGAIETAATTLTGRVSDAEGDITQLQADVDAAEAAHTELLANAIVKDGSVAFTGNQSMGNNRLTSVADPVNATDATNKQWVETKVAALGNAFNYVGTLEGGADAANAYDLRDLPVGGKDVGDYYKVTALGYFTMSDVEGDARFFNTNDGLVFNEAGGFDKIDNTDATVAGTAGQVVVGGNVDTGYIVSIDGAYTAARTAEVAAEAALRDAADVVLQGNIDDVVADLAAEATAREDADDALGVRIDGVEGDLAQELLDRAAADLALQGNIDDVAADLAAAVTAYEAADVALDARLDTAEADITGLKAADVAIDGRLDVLEAAVGDDTRLDNLEANVATAQTDINALELADVALDGRLVTAEADIVALEGRDVAQQVQIDALIAADVALDTRLDTAEGDITALESNVATAQADIDAIEDALENLSQDTITSTGTIYSVHAADDAVEFRAVGSDVGLDLTLSDLEARLSVNSASADADLRLVAKGAGQVIIGDEGVGIIQADDSYSMTVAGGAGGGELFLKADKVSIQDEDNADIATFVSGGASNVAVSTAAGGVKFAAEGAAADLDLTFQAKGAGRIDVSGAKVVNVAAGVAATDAVNKGQLDSAVAAAQVGHVVSVAATVALTGVVALGEVNGIVTRVRVVILNAYNSGATITVGTDTLAADLVASADLDEAAAGVYLIETAREYAAEDLVVTVTGATSGAAKVYVEYIAA